jgi:hypothetical protein
MVNSDLPQNSPQFVTSKKIADKHVKRSEATVGYGKVRSWIVCILFFLMEIGIGNDEDIYLILKEIKKSLLQAPQ